VLFRKSAAGMRGALAWLDAHLDEALAELPSPRLVSVLELALFCLMRHFDLRPTVPLDPLPRLTAWAEAFGQRPSAARTPFRAGGFVDHAWPEERS
jgi:glutathione S-transferase